MNRDVLSPRGEAATVTIASGVVLVRQGIAQRLRLLGAAVHEYVDAAAAVRAMSDVSADILILDSEEAGLDWRALVRDLRQARPSIQTVLFSRQLSMEDLADAGALAISAVILRPFREEEHMHRLADLVRRVGCRYPRRRESRFHPEPDSSSLLLVDGELGASYRVIDLSQRGASLAVSETELRRLPESGTAPVHLTTWGVRAGIQATVVWTREGRLGLRFESIGSGRQEYLEHVESLRRRVFGSRRVGGPW